MDVVNVAAAAFTVSVVLLEKDCKEEGIIIDNDPLFAPTNVRIIVFAKAPNRLFANSRGCFVL